MARKTLITIVAMLVTATATAQIGDYRSELAVGVSGGVSLSSVDYVPDVPEGQLMGKTFGVTLRYTGEKYFNSICAVVVEVNFTQMGWQERIWDKNDQPVINKNTGVAEEYSRIINYIQMPFFARMGWGRERRGFQGYFQIGPQLGYYLNEKTVANFDLDRPNTEDRVSLISRPDYSNMYHMPVENKLDYGITVGAGVEFSNHHLGHFLIEGRYYYGLGNIYGNSKRDYFAKSNYQGIVVKATYLFDILKSKNPKIK